MDTEEMRAQSTCAEKFIKLYLGYVFVSQCETPLHILFFACLQAQLSAVTAFFYKIVAVLNTAILDLKVFASIVVILVLCNR